MSSGRKNALQRWLDAAGTFGIPPPPTGDLGIVTQLRWHVLRIGARARCFPETFWRVTSRERDEMFSEVSLLGLRPAFGVFRRLVLLF